MPAYPPHGPQANFVAMHGDGSRVLLHAHRHKDEPLRFANEKRESQKSGRVPSMSKRTYVRTYVCPKNGFVPRIVQGMSRGRTCYTDFEGHVPRAGLSQEFEGLVPKTGLFQVRTYVRTYSKEPVPRAGLSHGCTMASPLPPTATHPPTHVLVNTYVRTYVRVRYVALGSKPKKVLEAL